ncbi:MAG: hypothetical protein MUP13_17395, partial [Thermoanaerobaculales bacterium]|nr:hypothetical protein [Thermoanaerobaculales bacterium]
TGSRSRLRRRVRGDADTRWSRDGRPQERRPLMRPAGWLFLPFALAVASGALSAQDATRAPLSCDGKIVSAILVTPQDPSFLILPRSVRGLARAAGVLHTTTKAGTIGSFLLLEVGRLCTERNRSESERILRLQPFLAEATVRAVPDGGGGVRIEVETTDEIPTLFGMDFHGASPSALRFGNGNVGGQGLSLAAGVERGFAYRTGMGVYGVAHQAFGQPYRATLAAERAPRGSTMTLAFGRPFLTDLQRTAWHMGYDAVNRFASFERPEGAPLSLAVRRRFWDVGGVRRIGGHRRSAFVGALLTEEDVTPADRAVVVSDSGLVADTISALGGPFPAYRNLRLNAVVGVRALSFMAVRGFDALTAVQDVATGVQLGTLIGWGIPRFGSTGDNLFASVDLYAGVGSATSFAAVRVEVEAREDQRTNRWDSKVGSGRLAWYVKPGVGHTFIGSVEFGGGWQLRTPFQLGLGDHQGGVRGYAASRVAGAVRGVVRMEERWSIGTLAGRAALGLATFADAGRVWAGDAPFGVDSRTKIGVGLGLLAAVPAQSQRLWRLDFAVPVSPDADARWEIRLTGIRTRVFWQEPNDVARGRAGAAPSTIFVWR